MVAGLFTTRLYRCQQLHVIHVEHLLDVLSLNAQSRTHDNWDGSYFGRCTYVYHGAYSLREEDGLPVLFRGLRKSTAVFFFICHEVCVPCLHALNRPCIGVYVECVRILRIIPLQHVHKVRYCEKIQRICLVKA